MRPRILIVDDDPDIVAMLQDRLQALGYDTLVAGDGESALESVEQQTPSLMLLDLELPKLPGLGVLQRLAEGRQAGVNGYALPVIMMTAFGTIARAVEAMKLGAWDFVTKPFDPDHLAIAVRKALEREVLQRQIECLRSEVDARYATIIGSSAALRAVVDIARRAAVSDAGVLLLGESGTGKELFARSIHQWSPRRAFPFVVINCVALTETLLENELFGHEKGAFTGADRQQKGKIELADGGTVFLDEIGDMPLSLQAKLLRVLQDHEFTRVGGTRVVRVNIRVLAATNRDLKQAVRAGTFREDLYFRLNVVSLTLPPLRERPEDIPALADHFLKRHAREAKRPHTTLTPEALDALRAHAWPGNIRELDNALARAVALSLTDEIGPAALGLAGLEPNAGDEPASYRDLPYHESMEAHSRAIIRRALQRARGNQTKAADLLKLQRTYLAHLIKQKNVQIDSAVGS
ncbi:sigma-54-dependent transcriptional regulator [Nitrospira sp. Kam-Ns4a]